ncbi:MAG: MCE family protein [Bacteroidales bacterium]|nr:MCE family protein [Bacteroidales bacterium]MBN2762574.1 MCE family protein [Bacteroidales bacterium]
MQRKKAINIGLFISLGVLIFIAGIYIVGKQQNIFGPTLKITAIFRDIKGLKIGDKVHFSGIDIGTVSSIELMSDTRVKTGFTIKENVVKLIKQDSKVTIANEGLMGGKIVIILPGSSQSRSVNEDDILQTIEQVDIDDILKEVKKSSENIAFVSKNLIDITDKVNRGDGIFGKIFTDTVITQNLDKTSRNITSISKNLVEISEKANMGQGFMGKLFTDTLFTRQLDSAGFNLKAITEDLAEVTEKVNAGEGVFGRLFTDTSLTQNLYLSSINLEQTTRNLVEFSHRLNNNENALSRFIADTAFADSLEILLYELNTGIREITRSSEAIQRSGLIRMFSKKKKN